MRMFAILLFVAALALGLAELNSHSIQKVKVARAEVQRFNRPLALPHPGPHYISPSPAFTPPSPGQQHAQLQLESAQTEASPFLYMQIILTALIVPFCLFLVIKRSNDSATKTLLSQAWGRF